MAVNASTENNPYTFSVMTINMDGKATAKKRREAVNYALKVTNEEGSPMKPDIVFAQELTSKSVKNHWLLEDTTYELMSSEKQAGLMWHPNVFTKVHKVDIAFITRVSDSIKLQANSSSVVKSRSSIALLQRNQTSMDSPTYKVLVISWHGQRSITETKRKQIFIELQRFALKLRDTLQREYPTDKIAILIGGDFNLAFSKPTKKRYIGPMPEKPFHYTLYQSSKRRSKKELIDNFLYTNDTLILSDITVIEPLPLTSEMKKQKKAGAAKHDKKTKSQDNIWIKHDSLWHLYSSKPSIMKNLDHDPVLVTVHII